MKQAKEYAEMAVRAGQLGTAVDPDEKDPCAQSLKLAVFHLRSAARLLRESAEFKAAREQSA